MSLGLALALLFSVGWLPVYLFRAESMREAFPAYGAAERLWVVMTPLLIALHFTVSAVTLSVEPGLSPGRALVGASVFCAGIGFWLWGRAAIGGIRRTRLPDEPPQRFRRDGPFGLVRNPLYFGDLVAASAPVLVSRSWLLVLTLCLCAGALAVRAAQEEQRLHAQLGADYAEYCRRVKRLIPFIW